MSALPPPDRVQEPQSAKVVLGTSLSAIDFTIALRNAGHSSPLVWASRSGILPGVRPAYTKYALQNLTAPRLRELASRTGTIPLKTVVNLVREEISLAQGAPVVLEELLERARMSPLEGVEAGLRVAARSHPYYHVAKGLDGVIPLIWRYLSQYDREKCKPYQSAFAAMQWPSPEVNMVRVRDWLLQGYVSVRAGIEDVEWCERSCLYKATFRDGGSLAAEAVIDCSGNGANVRLTINPLVQSLVAQNLVVPHSGGGIHVDHDSGRVVDASGRRLNVWVLAGSLTHGTHYFTSNLATISESAAKAVSDLLMERSSVRTLLVTH